MSACIYVREECVKEIPKEDMLMIIAVIHYIFIKVSSAYVGDFSITIMSLDVEKIYIPKKIEGLS